jgi:ATP-dependent DNA helicase RecQ
VSLIHELLQRHWGYSSFRPRQQEIVEAILAGRDVAAVLPTGGGKSLCYQLPALASHRTAVVVSPLIALMQDQVFHLDRARIPAAFLNSSLDRREQAHILSQAERGRYRLLYLSPERLVREDTLEFLERLEPVFFAVDEAHCISEWGHEFRPEYRMLRSLRDRFPNTPIAAFTASATRSVRHDIVHQLRLKDPTRVVLSFRRPNLSYQVKLCDAKQQLAMLKAAVAHYSDQHIIIYGATTQGVEQIADTLQAQKIGAVPYHGKMDQSKREKNQDLWMTGKRNVMVATMAFGLGVNKPEVRAVIHLAMPKSLEQYYQEAGRAGRDGDPADCVLLWQNRDKALQAHFIQEIGDAGERERSWQRYHIMKRYNESKQCRQRYICEYFGEKPSWDGCGVCDNCAGARDWMSARATKTRKADKTVKTAKPAKAKTSAAPAADSPAHERLRAWRAARAKANGVAPFMILANKTIDALVEAAPVNRRELLAVHGIGEAKAEAYGAEILATLNGD